MFRLTLQLSDVQVQQAIVELDYFDGLNDYHQTAVLILRRGDRPVVWEFPLKDPTHRTYRIRYWFYSLDGNTSESPWEERSLDGGMLMVGGPLLATSGDNLFPELTDRYSAPTADLVHFTVAAAPVLAPASVSDLSVWAHTEAQREEVLRRIGAAHGDDSTVRSKGPVSLPRDSLLTLRATVEGLRVEPEEDDLLWAGEIASTTFLVAVPEASALGTRPGLITIRANGLQIARVHFTVVIGSSSVETAPLPSKEELHRRAFASYASADRDEVLRSVQGMQKVAPQLDVFMDVLSLRSGEDWAQRLWTVIPMSDVFYLFWSAHAKESPWVEREWRCAMRTRGSDFIDPVPLEGPDAAPPPPELASRHFSDWTLAFRRRKPDETSSPPA